MAVNNHSSSHTRLTATQAQQVYAAIAYSYEAGDLPPSSPQWLVDYCTPDGGLLDALHQIANPDSHGEDDRP